MKKLKPTARQYECFQKMFDYLNQNLFQESLPNCLLSFTRLSKKTDGYFIPSFWVESEATLKHGICINPLLLVRQNKTAVLSTLCHNMVHLYQAVFSTLPKQGYHNRKWADKMEEFGLIPSHTGKPGGKKQDHQ